jgi:hypothetical protein
MILALGIDSSCLGLAAAGAAEAAEAAEAAGAGIGGGALNPALVEL